MLSDLAQGAFGALIDRPEAAQRMALAAATRLGLAGDPAPAPWPAWKMCAAAGGVGLLTGLVLGLYLDQRHGRYVPNVFGRLPTRTGETMAYYAPGVTGRQGYVDTSQPVYGGTSQVLRGLGCGGGWPAKVPAGNQGGMGFRGLGASADDSDPYLPPGMKMIDGDVSAQIALKMAGRVISVEQAGAGVFCGDAATLTPPNGIATADANATIESWAAAGYFVLLFQGAVECAQAAGGGDFFKRVKAADLFAAGATAPNAYLYRLPGNAMPTKGFWRFYGLGPGQPATAVPAPGCQAGYAFDPGTGLCWPQGGTIGQGISLPPIGVCPDGSVSLTGACPQPVGPAVTPGMPEGGMSPGAKVVVVLGVLLLGYALFADLARRALRRARMVRCPPRPAPTARPKASSTRAASSASSPRPPSNRLASTARPAAFCSAGSSGF